MPYKDIIPPAGEKISIDQGQLTVPDNSIIPFIRGEGIGPDIWAANERVFDAAVEKASGGKKKIAWFEVFAGQPAIDDIRLCDRLRRVAHRSDTAKQRENGARFRTGATINANVQSRGRSGGRKGSKQAGRQQRHDPRPTGALEQRRRVQRQQSRGHAKMAANPGVNAVDKWSSHMRFINKT